MESMRRTPISIAIALTAILVVLRPMVWAQPEPGPANGPPSAATVPAASDEMPRNPLTLYFLGQPLPELAPAPTALPDPDLADAPRTLDGPPCNPAVPSPVPVSPLKPQLGTVPGYLGSAGGGGGLGMAFSPVVGHIPYSGGYSDAEFFNSGVKGQNAHLGYFQQNLNFLMPIWQSSTDEFYADGRVGVETFSTNAILPSTQQPFPSDLWNIGLGTGYRHLFDNGWTSGGSISVGSASDQPFHSIREMTISASVFTRVPSGDRNAWVFGAAMSSNSQVLPYIPIPFAAYLYNPSKDFQAMLGFPFANVIYRPVENLTLSMSYALLTNFHVRATYQIARSWSVFAGLEFDNENYWLADRQATDQLFFYYNDRLSAGSQIVFSRNVLLQFSGGYIFDRYYFEGTSFTSGQNFNRVSIEPGAFLAAHLQVRF